MTDWVRCSESFPASRARRITSNITCSYPVWRGCSLRLSPWELGRISPRRVNARFMKRKSRGSERKWKKIPRKKSKRCRSSINCRGSLPKNHKKWRSVSLNSPSSSCRRWHKVSSACPSIAFRISGHRQSRQPSQPQSALSFQSFHSFSWEA